MAATLNFDPTIRDSTIMPFLVTVQTRDLNGIVEPLDLTNTTLCWQVKHKIGYDAVVYEFDFTLIDAVNGVIQFDQQNPGVPAFNYVHELKVVDSEFGDTPLIRGTFTRTEKIAGC